MRGAWRLAPSRWRWLSDEGAALNPNDLEVIKSSAEGVAAGATQSLHTLVVNLLGGFTAEVGAELTESAKRWRERRALDLGSSVLGHLEGRTRRPIARNVLLPAFDYATLEDRQELVSLWVQRLATAGTEGRQDVDRDFVEILRDLKPLDARVLQWVRTRPPELDGNAPRAVTGRQYVGPPLDSIRPRATKKSVCEAFSLSDEEFEQLASRLERLGLCDVARFVFRTRFGGSATGPRVYDSIGLRPIGVAFVDAVTPSERDS